MPTKSAKPAVNPLRRDVDREVVQAWLDALSTGACDEPEFLRAVEKLTHRSVEAGWDALALLDQYYRLGKIPAELFSSIKARLGSQLVGAKPDEGHGAEELSVPLPQGGETQAPAAQGTRCDGARARSTRASRSTGRRCGSGSGAGRSTTRRCGSGSGAGRSTTRRCGAGSGAGASAIRRCGCGSGTSCRGAGCATAGSRGCEVDGGSRAAASGEPAGDRGW